MEEKKHPATGRRRYEYRERGEIARSRDLLGAAIILCGAMIATMTGGNIAKNLVWFGRTAFGELDHLTFDIALASAGRAFVMATGPILIATMIAVVALGLAQTKGAIATKSLGFDITRLNPLPRLQQLFASKQAAIGLAMSLVKVAIVGGVIYVTMHDRIATMLVRIPVSLSDGLMQGGDLLRTLTLRVGIAMLVIGLGDYGVNWYMLEVKMRMTDQEVTDEHKDDLGNPQVRSRRRRRMREMVRQRRMKGVAKADVVVTNPTHFAVALVYRSRRMGAPRVVAKGAGVFALRLREIAKRAGVPIIEQPPLARALFRYVAVGREVPAELYKAVAVVLAYVYRLRRRSA